MAAAAFATQTLPLDLPYTPMLKKPLPAGRPREWYIHHNRRLKAMRLAIALLDAGAHGTAPVKNRTIRSTAEMIGIHPPSDVTCQMVRALMHYSR